MPRSSNATAFDSESIPDASSDFRELGSQIDNAKNGSLKLGSTLAKALDGIISKGKSATSVIDTLALSLSKAALKSAFKPLDGIGSGLLGNLLSGSALDQLSDTGVSSGLPLPFATGGVISSPVSFPLGGGQTGIAGERGPEAILPLSRGADGKLGIAGNSSGATPVNVTFNISTPDAQSFARSETQVAALLARAVSQGQRNL